MDASPEPLPGPQRIEFDNVGAVIADLEARCARLVPSGPVVVDLSGLTEFDSSAVSVLLELARRRGAPVTASNPPAKLAELAELYGVAELLFGAPAGRR